MLELYDKPKAIVAFIPFAICVVLSFILTTVGHIAGEIATDVHDWTLKDDNS